MVSQPRRCWSDEPHHRSSVLRPTALGESLPAIAPDQDPRLKLAEWICSPTNPYFAKSLVNRYWKHFFRRGFRARGRPARHESAHEPGTAGGFGAALHCERFRPKELVA